MALYKPIYYLEDNTMTHYYTTLYPFIISIVLLTGGYLVYRFWPTIQKILIFGTLVSSVLTCVYFYVQTPEVIEKIIQVEVERPEQDRVAAYKQALREIPPKYGIHPLEVEAIEEMESSNGDMDAVKTEFHNPRQIAIAAKFTNDREKQKLLAISYCRWQVMGYEAEKRGVPYYKLHDPRVCVEIGSAVRAEKRSICEKKGVSDYYDLKKCTAKYYNGDGPDAEAYSNKFMEILNRKALKWAFKHYDQERSL